MESVFEKNFGQTTANVSCQTELKGTVSRNLDVVIIYDKPFNLQSTKPPILDTECQTNLSGNVIDFMANGSQKYEQLLVLGLIRAVDLNTQKVNEETLEEYVENLIK